MIYGRLASWKFLESKRDGSICMYNGIQTSQLNICFIKRDTQIDLKKNVNVINK